MDERRKRRKRENRIAWLVLIGIVLTIFSLGTLFGWHLGTAHAVTEVDKHPVVTEVTRTSSPLPLLEVSMPEPVETYILSDAIVSDGRLLSYELQTVMQEYCTEYNVPYALALAVAERESNFNPDAKSGTNDYGLMQINKINHKQLKELGIDPLTHKGNIHAGILMLSQKLERYGDYELALMAYNCGDTGAKRLWDAGTYSTKYSRAVMERYQKWLSILEDPQ